jgi:hypothetical protein
MTALLRIDARHVLHSPLLWIGAGLAVAVTALQMATFPVRALPGDDVNAYWSSAVLAAGALLAGSSLGLRDRLSGAQAAVAATPAPRVGFWGARIAAIAVAATAAVALLFAAALTASAALGGRGVPDLRLAADAALGAVLAGVVGLVLGRLTGSRLVCLLAAPVWAGASVAAFLAFPEDLYGRLLPLLAFLTRGRSVVLGFLPDRLGGHLAYLGGLVLLAVALTLLAVAVREGRRVRATLAVLVAAALCGAGTAVAAGAALARQPAELVVRGPDPSDWFALDAPEARGPVVYPDDGLATACGDGIVQVCLYPAYSSWTGRAQAEVDAAAALIAGLPGVAGRVRMVPYSTAPCQDDEVQLDEGLFAFSGNALAAFADCAVGRQPQPFVVVGPLAGPVSIGEPPEVSAAGVVSHWIQATALPSDRELALRFAPEVTADQYASFPGTENDSSAVRATVLAEQRALDALLAMPPEQARRELEPLWDRLRAGEVSVEELPGAAP